MYFKLYRFSCKSSEYRDILKFFYFAVYYNEEVNIRGIYKNAVQNELNHQISKISHFFLGKLVISTIHTAYFCLCR